MRPRRARVLERGRFAASFESAYESIHEVQHDDQYRVAFDGETWHNSLRLRYGLGWETDIEVEAGFLAGRGGYLDDFAEAWHDFFGLPDGGRSNDPKDLYRMRIRRDPGEVLYELEEDHTGFMDVPIVLTRQLAASDDGRSAWAARLGLELPTGDEDKGYGNGTVDYGAGLLGERHFDSSSWYWSADYIVTGDPPGFRRYDVTLEDILHLQLGVELPITRRSAFLTQIRWLSPLVREIHMEEIDSNVIDLGFGVAYLLGSDVVLRLSFHEDVVAATGPDFTMFLSLSWGL